MGAPHAFSKPVVLMYHRFELKRAADTVVTPSDFDAQLAYLKKNGIEVLAALDAVNAMRQGNALPDHAVIITIDDGWKSALTAKSKLNAYGYPYTLALYTQMQDIGSALYLSKADIKEFAQDPSCTIANHSYSHSAPVMRGSPQKARVDLERAQTDIENMTGRRPELFVYPYGIVNRPLRGVVASLGFTGAFGIEPEKPLGPGTDPLNIPRYTVITMADFDRAMRDVEKPSALVGTPADLRTPVTVKRGRAQYGDPKRERSP
ncbi:conserved hypothetical protein [Ricinus communis]|uniref:NodB homology domain-containing protein n=1 Tax=Ricinus communis TaxID=3988 RepID=B9TJS1_RICCO|nr:conserved hypothetical protein [Ricinus communis]